MTYANQAASNERPPQISRRRVLAMAVGWSAPVLGISLAEGAEKPARRRGVLARNPELETLGTRTKIVLELDGEVQVQEPKADAKEELRTSKVRGKSTLQYTEQIALAKAQPIASQRRYSIARTENWVSGSSSSFELRSECRDTVMLRPKSRWKQYCPSETLTHREIELVDSPINSACLELLLPEDPARPNQPWDLPAEHAAEIFNLHAVHKSTITSRVTKVEDGKATIELQGAIDGTVHSVPTHIDVQGSYQVTLAESGALVSWLALMLKEKRTVGAFEPGFEIAAKVRLIREERDAKSETHDRLVELAGEDDEGRWLISIASPRGGYTMLADRRWKMYTDGGEEAILRMVENNVVIAQCNVMYLTPLNEGQQLTLEGLQADIRAELGDSFQQFLESGEKKVGDGLRLLRVVAMGNREEVPIQWVYSHLSDDSGKRLIMVYTMGGNVTDRFAASDEQMSSSFRFIEKQTSEPKAAPQLTQGETNPKR
ncbi:MAG TPA: hypothetical protein DDW52_24885 [Planctomycetaceae bacterium]|nr:hypothetical protein [Planctomycetaceae bacterium]